MNRLLVASTSGRQPGPRRWSQPLIVFTALSILAGCAGTPAGSAGGAAFIADASRIRLTSSRGPAQAAQRFEDQAKFLPLSTFSRDAATATFTYRRRVSDLWFEEVRIAPNRMGSLDELRVAPNLDAKWVAQFDQDGVLPLRRCLGI